EMDVIVVVSNCPQINHPSNACNPTPVRMIVAA
ncbi:MAG: urea carboxylase, partial [Erythrobacteraceae bacterium]